MKYIITNHSKQRRPHHSIKEDKFLLNWMKAFDNKFNFSSLKINSAYKIHYKSNTIIIKRKKENIVVLITFRGFPDSIEKFDFDKLIFREVENRDARLLAIHRINFNGKIVKCGRVLRNTQTKEKYRLTLKKSLDVKFKIPCFEEYIDFNNFKDIEQFVNKDVNDGLFYLNQFERRKTRL